jgi:hypothetical protein
MENQFITYEIAKQLKDLGFDEPCLACYTAAETIQYPIGVSYDCQERTYYLSGGILAPLYQQVVDWFIEKHNLHIQVTSWIERGKIVWYYSTTETGKASLFNCVHVYEKSNLALEAGILKAIESIKN